MQPPLGIPEALRPRPRPRTHQPIHPYPPHPPTHPIHLSTSLDYIYQPCVGTSGVGYLYLLARPPACPPARPPARPVCHHTRSNCARTLRLGAASCRACCARHSLAVATAVVACCAWPSHPVRRRRMPRAQSQLLIDSTCDKTMLVHPDHNPVHPTAHLQPLHCCAHRLDCHQRDRTTEAMRPSPVYR